MAQEGELDAGGVECGPVGEERNGGAAGWRPYKPVHGVGAQQGGQGGGDPAEALEDTRLSISVSVQVSSSVSSHYRCLALELDVG